MNTEQTFTNVDDQVLCEAIAQARLRLVFVAPGIRPPVAQALAMAMRAVPATAIHLVLDVDAEVCRLGYGDREFKGMEILQVAATKHNLTVNHHPGIRIGLLIADDATLIYSPTPELIETESHQPDKPNAIILQRDLPAQLANACGIGDEGFATLQVGRDQIDEQAVQAVKNDLQDRPPKEFNVARIERVFNSMLQYVELTIEDYKLTTRSLLLKPGLFGVRNADVTRRLINRYHLFSNTDALTVEIPHFGDDARPDREKPRVKFGPLSIDRDRKLIKEQFIIKAGVYGLLILRRKVLAFERAIEVLKAKISAYQQAVQEQIKERTDEIVNELLIAMHGGLKSNPPDHWRGRYLGEKPDDEDVKRLFTQDVQGEVNRVKTDFKPRVFTTYKDVTYQTFMEPKFRELMNDRFGAASIDRVFSEHDAAPETKG